MSEMSEVSTATVTGSAEAGGEGGGSNAPMIAVALVLLLVLGGMVYFVGFAEQSNVEPTETESGRSGREPSGPLPNYPPSNPAPPSPRGLVGTTYGASSDSRSSGAQTTGSVTSSTQNPNARPAKIFACTYGKAGVIKAMVPPDGTCDIIFYTDVLYQDKRKTIEPIDSGLAFHVLETTANAYTKTTFGTSMSIGSGIKDTVASKKKDLMKAMDQLFQAKMVHFGMLNVDTIENYDELEKGTLKYLDVVKEVLAKKKQPPFYHCALGVGLTDGKKLQEILNKADDAVGKFSGITMVVIKVHTEKVIEKDNLFPVGPNPDGVSLNQYRVLTLMMISNRLKQRLEKIADRKRYAMLSIAMYVRSYRMKSDWTDETERVVAESNIKIVYPLICGKQAKADPFDSGTMYVANTKAKFLALFDTVDTFKAKMESRVQKSIPRNLTGMMAYHVEMDDFRNCSGAGSFGRLHVIRTELFKSNP